MVRPSVISAVRWVAVGALVAAVGCTPAEPLEERVAKYWKARTERDAATAYTYENPATRGSEGEYVARIAAGPLAISGVTIEKVEVDGDEAKVTTRVTYRHALMPRDVKAPIVDLWTKVDGRWYHDPPPAEFVGGGSGLDEVLRRRTPVAKP